MNIVIAGGGRVGLHLARLLCEYGHNLTVMDEDSQRREEIDSLLDARTVVGDAASALLLQSLDVGSADLFIGCTGDERTNVIAASIAKALGAQKCVARINSALFLESSLLYENMLNIDYLLNPDALAAHDIILYVEHPSVISMENFAKQQIQVRSIELPQDSPAHGRMVSELLPPGSGVLIGAMFHDGNPTVVRGNTRILGGSRLVLIGPPDRLDQLMPLFVNPRPNRKIAVFGGDLIGVLVAKALDKRKMEVKVLEKDPNRCEEIAQEFYSVKVVNRDGASRAALRQEHLESYDVFIATTRDDERNIVSCVLARECGVKQAVAVIHHPDFANLARKLDIDLAVTPRSSFAKSILHLIYQKDLPGGALLGEGQLEMVEITIKAGTSLDGYQIAQATDKLPENSLIACILRGDRFFIPRGTDHIQADDRLMLIIPTQTAEAVKAQLTSAAYRPAVTFLPR
ncbi:MAG TPA: Trk system potassium transporter TrkA [Candidatus Hydrogenedentes bacterium]|nr:Trk system potassium transporter TrkA [Candidatus Hydrogenedentota bacterium]HPU98527.1 Trk system potassium transporter TrkA [Candidatus Hydrogenedentota bacterium]